MILRVGQRVRLGHANTHHALLSTPGAERPGGQSRERCCGGGRLTIAAASAYPTLGHHVSTDGDPRSGFGDQGRAWWVFVLRSMTRRLRGVGPNTKLQVQQH